MSTPQPHRSDSPGLATRAAQACADGRSGGEQGASAHHPTRYDSRFGLRVAVAAFFLVACLATFMDVRPFASSGERFIGHADQAQIAQIARNIAEGNGPRADTEWLLHGGGGKGPEIRHRERYWSIYVAYLMAPFFKILGADRTSILLLASLTKTALAALAFFWVWRFRHRAYTAAVAGIVTLLAPEVVRCTNGLSDIYLALSIFAAISAMFVAARQGSMLAWGVGGLFTGLAIGLKPSGMILLGLLPFLLLFAPDRRRAAVTAWPFLLSLALSLTPLALHNYRASGSILWPDLPIMKSALLKMDATRNSGTFDWDEATMHAWCSEAYDPQSTMAAISPFSGPWLRIHAINFIGFIRAAATGSIVALWTLPFVFCAGVGWLRRRRAGFRSVDGYDLFVGLTLALVCGTCCLAATVHTEPRYFLFLWPPMMVLALVEATRFTRQFVTFALVYTSVVGLGYYAIERAPYAVRTRQVAQFHQADQILPANARVMASNPWEFTFHTRRPSVVATYNPDLAVMRDLAGRFRIDYLVIIDQDIRHPTLNPLNQGHLPDFLELIHRDDRLIIARFVDRGTDSVAPAQ